MTEPQPPIGPGTFVDDRHRVDEVLGSGGFATVYLGTDTTSGRRVAVKVLAADHAASEVSRARFDREIQAVARLTSPHTVRLFTHGQLPDSTPFIIFEHVPGRDLGEVLADGDRLDPTIVFHVVRQVLESLREAHHAGVLHRDIKPANIRVTERSGDRWAVKVLDFGIARFDESKDDAKLTRAGELLGTPRYMSPEQLLDEPLGPESDIYSLGLVAVEMLVGSYAMHGNNWADQLDRLQTGHLFATVGAHAHLHRVIEKMTARDPRQRFRRVEDVLRALDSPVALQEISAGAPPPYAPPPTKDAAPDGASDGRRIWPLVVGVCAIAVGVIAIGVIAIATKDRGASRDDHPRSKTASETRSLDKLLATTPTVAATLDAGAEPQDASTADVVVAPPSGCGLDPGWTGTRRFTVSVPGTFVDRQRRYAVYLPKGYDRERAYPVVMLFQTLAHDRESLIVATRAKEFADREGFMVVSLDKVDNNKPFGEDDFRLLQDALADLGERACVDPGRMFAIGHGIGGAFARAVACSMPLAGVATAGDWVQADAGECSPDPPVPFIRMAGLQDRYVPVRGGASCMNVTSLSLEDVEARWRTNNECSGNRKRWTKKRGGTCFTWACEQAPFVSCHIEGGHYWPDSQPPALEFPGCISDNPTFPMMATIWEFFSQQPSRDR